MSCHKVNKFHTRVKIPQLQTYLLNWGECSPHISQIKILTGQNTFLVLFSNGKNMLFKEGPTYELSI